MEHIIIGVAVAVVVVAIVVALSTVSDKLGVAPPLILMLVGAGISFLPFIRIPVIQPEWILVVVLPPLLHAAAISIPTVDLRRDFSAVGGLAVLLVVIGAVVFGFIVNWLIPDIDLALGIALGVGVLGLLAAVQTQAIRRWEAVPVIAAHAAPLLVTLIGLCKRVSAREVEQELARIVQARAKETL